VKSTNTHTKPGARTHIWIYCRMRGETYSFACPRLYGYIALSGLVDSTSFWGGKCVRDAGRSFSGRITNKKKIKKGKKKRRGTGEKHQDNRKKWSRMFGVESQEIDFFSWFGPRTQYPGPGIRDLPLRRCQTEFIDDWFALCAYLSQCRFYLHDWGVRGAIIALACI